VKGWTNAGIIDGDPLEVLEVVDVSEPGAPGANEALLGIEIASLNKHDLLFIGNALGGGPALPTIVGNEGFGRVLAIGRGVRESQGWRSRACTSTFLLVLQIRES
jgi:NADPH:quinone reductase-like Zn-dependent oxidoreductase